jgi:hypothetical protein
MKKSWEKQKAYMARRAVALGNQMDEAIEKRDKEAFVDSFTKAMNYMRKAERTEYMKRFCAMLIEERHMKQLCDKLIEERKGLI